MKISDVNPHIRVAMHSIIQNDIKRRVIYDYELIYVEKGEFEFVYNDVSHKCRGGEIIFICPGVPHSFVLHQTKVSQPHIHFDISYRFASEKIPVSFKDVCDMSMSERNFIHKNYFCGCQRSPFVLFRDKIGFEDLFFGIIERYNANDALTAKGMLTTLIAQLVRDNYPRCFEEHERLSVEQQIKDYIDACQGFKMNLDDFSEQFSYNKFYMEKRFKESFGIGIIEYRNNKKLEYAVKLLETVSVTKAAEELGYGSVYSFSRAFKNFHGCSPQNYLSFK